jgi:hypothetical protein
MQFTVMGANEHQHCYGRSLFWLVQLMLTATHLMITPLAFGQQGTIIMHY